MDVWVPVALAAVICVAILIAFKNKWVNKVVWRRGDDELEVGSAEEEATRNFTVERNEFIDSDVDSAGVNTTIKDTKSRNTRWKMR